MLCVVKNIGVYFFYQFCKILLVKLISIKSYHYAKIDLSLLFIYLFTNFYEYIPINPSIYKENFFKI